MCWRSLPPFIGRHEVGRHASHSNLGVRLSTWSKHWISRHVRWLKRAAKRLVKHMCALWGNLRLLQEPVEMYQRKLCIGFHSCSRHLIFYLQHQKIIIGFHPPAFTEEPNVISPLFTARPKLNLIATELRNHPKTLKWNPITRADGGRVGRDLVEGWRLQICYPWNFSSHSKGHSLLFFQSGTLEAIPNRLKKNIDTWLLWEVYSTVDNLSYLWVVLPGQLNQSDSKLQRS